MVLRDDTVSSFDFLYRLLAIVALLQLILALLGLFLPGWLLARSLRMPAAWAAAMPLSALVICQSVVVLACLGWRIEFWRVAAVLALVSAVAAAAAAGRWQDWAAEARAAVVSLRGRVRDRQVAVLAGFVATIVAVFAVRVTLWPLSGWDTFWRWEWLARLLLEEGSLAHYPPVTAEDFAVYPYPDGIPPLVSGVYWWLYAGLGVAVPRVTAVAVVAEYVSLLGLVHAAAERLSGRGTGWLAAAAAAATPLLTGSVAIGQETGFTALAVAGQILCGLAARETPSWRLAVACGLFAALGGLARDYGPALGVCGVMLLAQSPATRRLVPVFVLAAATAGLWYARSWALTGNPVYSTPTPLGLPANPVHALILESYKQSLGLTRQGWAAARTIAEAVAYGGLATLLLGLAGLCRTGRAAWPLMATVGIVIGLWAWSVGYTAGGVWYSLRVLSPAWTVLAVLVPAGVAGIPSAAGTARGSAVAATGFAMAVAAGLLALVAMAIYPIDIARVAGAPDLGLVAALPAMSRTDPIEECPDMLEMLMRLEAAPVPACRLLTDSAYVPLALRRAESRFEAVIVWSPEVAFLFDPRVAAEEAQARLHALGIRLALIREDSLAWPALAGVPLFVERARGWPTIVGTPGSPGHHGIRGIR